MKGGADVPVYSFRASGAQTGKGLLRGFGHALFYLPQILELFSMVPKQWGG